MPRKPDPSKKAAPPPLYTYQAGRRVPLEKAPDEFVIRGNPDTVKQLGYAAVEAVSPSSQRVTVDPAKLDKEMDRTRAVTTAHHSYYLAGTNDEFLITDRIFVRFRHAPSPEELDAFRARHTLVQRERYSDREFLFQLTVHSDVNPVKLVVALVENEANLVESAEHDLNRRMTPYAFTLPTDPLYNAQWHLHQHTTSTPFDPRASTRCEDAWRLLGNFGDAQVVVGITDDGCKLDHSDFSSTGKFADWAYFVGTRLVHRSDPDANPALMFTAGASHGTSCAGVVAGGVDGKFTVGAAPGVRLLPVKWESKDGGLFISDSKFRTVLDFVADKVDVLSNSWGAPRQSTWSHAVIDRLSALAHTGGRRGKGIVFLWSAGNDNCPVSHTAEIDIPFTSGWKLDSNGNRTWIGVQKSRVFENNLVGVDGVMHVAAVSSTAQRSHYSNYGTGVGVCAPSNNAHTYSRLTVPGLGITTTFGELTGVTDHFGGTSGATPLVAAIAALVISANPDLTAIQVIQTIKRAASKDLDVTGYPRTPPWPRIDPDVSWDVSPIAPFDDGAFKETNLPDGSWSPWFGHGRVDALAAVTRATELRGQASLAIAKSSAPNRVIPDNKIGGITDTITVPDAGLLRSVAVNVAIRHPWIGDLRVRLRSPAGSVITLHNRSGSGVKEIRRAYTSSNFQDLAGLVNEPVKGIWTLQAEDLAAADEGVLEGWDLKLSAIPPPLHITESPGAAIPDHDINGLIRTLVVPAGTIAREVAIQVQATHPVTAELSITITPPRAPAFVLLPRGGATGDRLNRTWTSAVVPPLAALRNHDIGGIWKLQILDFTAQNQGKLDSWSIDIQ